MKALIGFKQNKMMLILILTLSIPFPAFSASQVVQSEQVNEYRIGPKDLLEITVFNLPELSQTVRVAEDGAITLSLLGRVEVSGLTAQELEGRLAVLLDQQYTKNARVTVFIREFQKVSVLGAVGRPGLYELVGPTTLLQIIAQAGGLTPQATNEVMIYRQHTDGKQTILSMNLGDIANGDRDLNIELQPKDVITVPVDQTLNVFVYGEVRTPGAVPYLSSKRITLLQAIAQAGGPTEWAKTSRITIKRRDRLTGQEVKIRVSLKRIVSGKIADIMLEEGDVVIVP